VIFTLALAGFAAAHPLGNFTVNHYSRIEVEKSQIKLRAVLDVAEIPTFQESQKIDADNDGKISEAELDAYTAQITPDYIANLQLSVDDAPVALRSTGNNVSLPMGSGNLPTLRIEWNLIGDLPDFKANVVHPPRTISGTICLKISFVSPFFI